MSLTDFSPNNFIVTLNGRRLESWGESNTPYTDEPINQRAQLRQGQASAAVKVTRDNPGRRVTLMLSPGSADSAYVKALMNSGATITMSETQLRTLEAAIGTEGVIVNDGPTGRGGDTITDDMYVIEFNSWTATKGGEG